VVRRETAETNVTCMRKSMDAALELKRDALAPHEISPGQRFMRATRDATHL